MKDARGREVDYLRISVTDRCNLRCVYCAPRTGVRHLCDAEMLSFDEIVRVVSVMTHLGVRRIKLTGGEPLMRDSLPELIHRLKKIHDIEQVTLTTNGTLLGRAAAGIVDAGIDAVTVSLDTLNREHFFVVTRKDMLDSVLEGIDRMRDYPQVSLKINCVPVGLAEDILSVAAIAKDSPISVRFIERMPLGKDRLSVELSSHDVIQQFDRMINRSTKNYEIDHVSSCNDLDVWQPAAENTRWRRACR